ncbi:LuxR C-terminal-related transcriptional regulator [Streptomyces sp. NBC_00696]|uniref:LuxR C-terminal-related transcriptional regulator n=1 Tax=Streptomyces sp. NBC_00696 TaxID=2903672 RepID=UPI002E35E141|nr:LuxR C-terminal-related transcriptional regulator [Streptomyces sp. NBC_00696]
MQCGAGGGKQYDEIATELSYSERTVRYIRYGAMKRMRARSRARTVSHAIRAELIPRPVKWTRQLRAGQSMRASRRGTLPKPRRVPECGTPENRAAPGPNCRSGTARCHDYSIVICRAGFTPPGMPQAA